MKRKPLPASGTRRIAPTRPRGRSRARRVLICGSRTYKNAAAIAEAVHGLPTGSVVIHGAARGADSLADLYARQNGLETEAYPLDWDKYGKGAGPVRNKQMLDEGRPTDVIAFVANPTNSPGTANMVLQALARGVPVEVYT